MNDFFGFTKTKTKTKTHKETEKQTRDKEILFVWQIKFIFQQQQLQ